MKSKYCMNINVEQEMSVAESDLSSKFSKLVRIILPVQDTQEMWVQSLGQEGPLE